MVLWILLALYVGVWGYHNRGALFDPDLQSDDARQHVMPMHRYATPPLLKDDPVALSMLAGTSFGFRALYAVTVPLGGVLIAAKIVQFLSYLPVMFAVILLARSGKDRHACAVLLGFAFLHSNEMIDRMAGGLQRGFSFPLIFLWMAGAFADRAAVRYAAMGLGALLYPNIALILLVTELIFVFREGWPGNELRVRRELRAWMIALMTCGAILIGDNALKTRHGSLPSLAQASANPAFGPQGRTRQVPLDDGGVMVTRHLLDVFTSQSTHEFDGPARWFVNLRTAGPLLLLAVSLLLVLMRLAPFPREAVALTIAAFLLFALACAFAFKLYIPERYLAYGLISAGCALFVSTWGNLQPVAARGAVGSFLRNALALVAMVGLIKLGGDGISQNKGMYIDRRQNEPLWNAIHSLPPDSRVCAHPMKGASDISLWTGRAATPGFEQLLPWVDESWLRISAEAMRALRLLYATRVEDLESLCLSMHITHILISPDAYSGDVAQHSAIFQPFNSLLQKRLGDIRPESLVLRDVPQECIVFRTETLVLIDAEKLIAALKR